MSRRVIPWVIAIITCLWVIAHASRSPDLIRDNSGDHDTVKALQEIKQRHDPMSWFRTDWPLRNGFYRPLPTLTLEFDLATHPNDGAGFGQTDGLLCGLGILALYWAMSELAESTAIGAACAVLFSLWITGGNRAANATSLLATILVWAILPVFILGVYRHRRKWYLYLPVSLALFYAASELNGVFVPGELNYRVLGWVPGRTATLMTLFALLAIAFYARYERLSARRDPPSEPGPLDPPATRSSLQAATGRSRSGWPLAVAACICTTGALACYEQAVMLPAALTGVAIMMRLRGLRVRWGWQAAFWVLLPCYLFLRHAVLPPGLSAYQAQQMRHGPQPWIDIAGALCPPAASIGTILPRLSDPSSDTFQFSIYSLFDTVVLTWIVMLAANVAGLVVVSKRWPLAIGALLLCTVSFMPMAWSKPFGHYYYWPSACRTLYVVCLLAACWKAVIIAVSPQARQAPPRPHPAPGSLPHP